MWEFFPIHNRSATKRTSKCKDCKKENRPARDLKREGYCYKRRRKQVKKETPLLYKARLIRTKLFGRVKKDDPRKEETPTSNEIYDWLISQQPFVCYYSQELIKGVDFHIDHKTPLHRGGSNLLNNLCIASPKMNTAKGGLNEKEFKELLVLVKTWDDGGESLLRRMRQGFYG